MSKPLPALIHRDADGEAEIAAGKQRVAERDERDRERNRQHYPSAYAEGDVWTPLKSLGDCPGCDARLNATYTVVKRRGIAWHVGCDPEPDAELCAICGTPAYGATGHAWACSWHWRLAQAVMWFTHALQSRALPRGWRK